MTDETSKPLEPAASDTATPSQLWCGCCTGTRHADGTIDKCVCSVHQHIPSGRFSRACSFHRLRYAP